MAALTHFSHRRGVVLSIQLNMATKEKPVKVTTISYLTDKFAAGAARVNGGEYPVSWHLHMQQKQTFEFCSLPFGDSGAKATNRNIGGMDLVYPVGIICYSRKKGQFCLASCRLLRSLCMLVGLSVKRVH